MTNPSLDFKLMLADLSPSCSLLYRTISPVLPRSGCSRNYALYKLFGKSYVAYIRALPRGARLIDTLVVASDSNFAALNNTLEADLVWVLCPRGRRTRVDLETVFDTVAPASARSLNLMVWYLDASPADMED